MKQAQKVDLHTQVQAATGLCRSIPSRNKYVFRSQIVKWASNTSNGWQTKENGMQVLAPLYQNNGYVTKRLLRLLINTMRVRVQVLVQNHYTHIITREHVHPRGPPSLDASACRCNHPAAARQGFSSMLVCKLAGEACSGYYCSNMALLSTEHCTVWLNQVIRSCHVC